MTESQEYRLTMGQAAAKFGITPRTLKRLLKDGGVPVFHLSGNLRVRESDLMKFMESRIRPIE